MTQQIDKSIIDKLIEKAENESENYLEQSFLLFDDWEYFSNSIYHRERNLKMIYGEIDRIKLSDHYPSDNESYGRDLIIPKKIGTIILNNYIEYGNGGDYINKSYLILTSKGWITVDIDLEK